MKPEKESSSSAQEPSLLLGILSIAAIVFGALVLSKSNTPDGDSSETVHLQDKRRPEGQSGQSPSSGKLMVHSPADAEKSKDGRNHKTPFWEKAAVVVALGILIINVFQMRATERAADAAKSSAQTAKDYLLASQRPWLKIKHRIISSLAFNSPAWQGAVASMTVEDTIDNVGTTVALDVVSWEDVIPVDSDLSLHTARTRQDQWCDANRQANQGGFTGYVLFPNDPFVQSSKIGPSMDVVTKAAETTPNGIEALRGKVAFALVGCVSYRSPTEPKTAPRHETKFIYRLGVIEPPGVMYPWVQPIGTALNLQLIPFPEGFSAD